MMEYNVSASNHNGILLPHLSWLLNFTLPVCQHWREFLGGFTRTSIDINAGDDEGGENIYRYSVSWLELNVSQQGLIVDRVVTKSNQEEAAQQLVDLCNNFFDSKQLSFSYSDGRFYLQSSKPLPDTWSGILQIYKQNLMAQTDFESDRSWLVHLNEVQMILGQQPLILAGGLINGFWPDKPLLGAPEKNFNLDDDGVYYALNNEIHALEQWLEKSLTKTRAMAKNNAEFILCDGNYYWQYGGIRKMILTTMSRFIRVY